MNMNMNTAMVLKELRHQRGLTQQDLADITGISRVSIGFYERGRRITYDNACRIATALGVDVSCLEHGVGIDGRLEKACTLLNNAGYKVIPDTDGRIGIRIGRSKKIMMTCTEIVDLVEGLLAEAEMRKMNYFRKRVGVELDLCVENGNGEAII